MLFNTNYMLYTNYTDYRLYSILYFDNTVIPVGCIYRDYYEIIRDFNICNKE